MQTPSKPDPDRKPVYFSQKKVVYQGYQLYKANYFFFTLNNSLTHPVYFKICDPISKNFNLRFERRSKLPPLSTLQIQLIFTPTQQKTYKDHIKLQYEGQQTKLQIVAYPSLNKDISNQIDKIFQFQPTLIGNTSTLNFKLKSKSEIPFGVQCTLTNHQSFSIVPSSTELLPNIQEDFVISFLPEKRGLIEGTCLITYNQYGIQPCQIKLLGEGVQIEKDSRFAITNKNLSASKFKGTQNMIKTLKNIDHSRARGRTRIYNSDKMREKQFLARIEEINNFQKEKLIKISSFLGDPRISSQEVNFLLLTREEMLRRNLENLKNQRIGRRNIDFDIDSPLIDFSPINETNWNQKRNQIAVAKKIKQNNIKRCISNMIYTYRIDRRTSLIRQLTQKYSSPQLMDARVNHQWLEGDNTQRQHKKLIEFSLQFQSMSCACMQVQYQDSNNLSNFWFQITSKTGFNDWVTLEDIWENYVQSLSYSPIVQDSSLRMYLPIEDKRILKKGYKIESFVREEVRDLKNLGVSNFNVIEPSSIYKNFAPFNSVMLESQLSYNDSTENDPSFFFTEMSIDEETSESPSASFLKNQKNMKVLKSPGIMHRRWMEQSFPLPQLKNTTLNDNYYVGLIQLPYKLQFIEPLTDIFDPFLDQTDFPQAHFLSVQQLLDQLGEEGKEALLQVDEQDQYKRELVEIQKILLNRKRVVGSLWYTGVCDVNKFTTRQQNKIVK